MVARVRIIPKYTARPPCRWSGPAEKIVRFYDASWYVERIGGVSGVRRCTLIMATLQAPAIEVDHCMKMMIFQNTSYPQFEDGAAVIKSSLVITVLRRLQQQTR